MSAAAKILLIEDALDQAELLEEVLQEHGFDVVRASTVAEGALYLATQAFALVLSDYITGPTADAARDAHELLDIAGAVPVVCMTAWRFSTSELADRFAFVLYKPFAPDELMAIVATLLSLDDRPNETTQVLRYFKALTDHDWDGLAALCTESVEYRVPQAGTRECQVVVGRTNFKNMARDTFVSFPDASFEVTDVAMLPRGAVARYTGRWTLPTNEVATLQAAVTFSFAAGQISGVGVRLDANQLHAMSGADADRQRS